MSQDSLPRKVRSFQASQQSLFGCSGTCDASPYPITQLLAVVRCKTGGVLADLGPDELHGVQFGCTSWKAVFMDPWMFFEKLLCGRRDMNFVAIPDKNNVTRHQLQHLFQEKDGVLRTQVTSKGAYTQADLSQFRTDEQGAKQIQALVMVQTRAGGGCSSPW